MPDPMPQPKRNMKREEKAHPTVLMLEYVRGCIIVCGYVGCAALVVFVLYLLGVI